MNTFDLESSNFFANSIMRLNVARHIDVYHVEDVNDVVKIEYNKEQAGKRLA